MPRPPIDPADPIIEYVQRILLIEDDPTVRLSLALALGKHGHEVEQASTGEMGIDALKTTMPDAVVLDIMLPGMDGFAVCRRIRTVSNVAIIMVTARGDDLDVVGGLEAGADDYVVKPVQPRVLDARIRAVLRRGEPGDDAGRERHRDLEIDRAAMTVSKSDVELSLTPTELRLLLELARSPGRVFSRQQLLEMVWELDYLGDSRLVDNCVQRLRSKIEDDLAYPAFVQTVRGFGYRFGPV